MPLDGHSYLVAQGWLGKGSGLRKNAISRPLAIPQKRSLAGLGKDRDEAFPFWDHLFTVAAKTIQVKIHNDEDDDFDTDSPIPAPILPSLAKTSTGILSNKRPTAGTPASSSGSTTPSLGEPPSSSSSGYRMTLVAAAKRDAAKRYLYSRFFRGPVLGPDNGAPETTTPSTPANLLGRLECNGCVARMVKSEGGDALIGTDKRESTETETRFRKKDSKKSKNEKKDEKKDKKKKRKDKGKGKEDSTKDGSDDRKRKYTDSKVEAGAVEIPKKRKKRKGSTDLFEADDATERSSDAERIRSKKMKLTSEITVESAENDADRESKYMKDEALERRRKQEEKKGRKERKDKRRKEIDGPSS